MFHRVLVSSHQTKNTSPFQHTPLIKDSEVKDSLLTTFFTLFTEICVKRLPHLAAALLHPGLLPHGK
jgi:hypothetical protein